MGNKKKKALCSKFPRELFSRPLLTLVARINLQLPRERGFQCKVLNHCNSNKSHSKTWQNIKGCSPPPARLLQCPAQGHSHPPFDTCSSWLWPHQGFRKPKELKVSPSLTCLPPNHTFFPHIWLHRIKKQCKQCNKNSLPFSYSKYWCTWWDGNRLGMLLLATITLCRRG